LRYQYAYAAKPVVAVPVEDDRRVVRDAETAEQLLELLAADEIPFDRILEVVAPVQADSSGYVTLVVERGVLVDLGNDDVRIVEVLGEPVGRDEN
jgi:hypothetical protein